MSDAASDIREVAITLPDGNSRSYPAGVTGGEIAADISKSLAKAALACTIDGKLSDLSQPVEADAALSIVTAKDEAQALELIRHDCAHIMARAVQELWPDVKVTIGPVIENGWYYDFDRAEAFTPEDLEKIEARMRQIIAARDPVRWEVWDRDRALAHYRANGENFKVELVEAIPADQAIRMYWHGDWQDLCRGPHLVHTGQIAGDNFKLMSVAGAYWRGDSSRPMLQRIYGVAFRTKDDLKAYLHRLEEAQKRDHRRLGREMSLFHLQEEAPGMVFWHPDGWTVYRALEDYMRRRLREAGYKEIRTPQVVDRKLWEASGHWEAYQEHMFLVEVEEEHAKEKRVNALKPMNCPCHVQIYNQGLKSYRDLPLRLAEFGACHRYEPSGSMHGLMRVRGFTQDDAHIFCTEDQIEAECAAFIALLARIYGDLGFAKFDIKLSTRPEKRIGSDETWDFGRERAGTRDPVGPERFRGRSGRGRFLRAEARFQADRRDRAGMAVRDVPGGFPAARAAGRGICRRGRGQASSGDAAPGDSRQLRAVPGHPDRGVRRTLPDVARAPSGRRRADRVGRRRLGGRGDRGAETRGPAGRGGSAQREDQLQGPRAFDGQGAGDPGGRRARGRGRHGVDAAARPEGEPDAVAGGRRWRSFKAEALAPDQRAPEA